MSLQAPVADSGVPLWLLLAEVKKDPQKCSGGRLHQKNVCLRSESAVSFTSRNPKLREGFSLTNEGCALCCSMARGFKLFCRGSRVGREAEADQEGWKEKTGVGSRGGCGCAGGQHIFITL